MFAAKQMLFIVAACLALGVAADTRGDISSLISNLGPLLSLFGELPTKQFMSQSLGWADNIIIAMAPLGILTIIVAAIRVGGPSWLKAVIGRARESLADAESEVMSSTSDEVREFWDGQRIVKTKQKEEICEFIILVPEERGKSNHTQGPGSNMKAGCRHANAKNKEVQAKKLKDAKNDKFLDERKPSVWERISGKPILNRQNHEQKVQDEEKNNDSTVVVVRNTDVEAPNVTLNVHNQLSRRDRYLIAAIGVILQLAVLVYSGCAVYDPTLLFSVNGGPVARYAFPCTAAGTLALVTGLLLCSHVVENSTEEQTYFPSAGKEARMVWLQRSKTAYDEFESFAIFPKEALVMLTTSQRRKPLKRKGEGTSDCLTNPVESFGIQAVTVIGAIVSICGFIVQFIGLQRMHWSALVAQVGATVVMAVLRALARLSLADIPKVRILHPEHEIDWLAMTLGARDKAPWQKTHENSSSKLCTADHEYGWRFVSLEDPRTIGPIRTQPTDTQSSADLSKAHGLMNMRKKLGALARWRGPASAEAIAVARAIAVTMNTLFPASQQGVRTWSIATSHGIIERESITFSVKQKLDIETSRGILDRKPMTFIVEKLKREISHGVLDRDYIAFSVTKKPEGEWEADPEEIEAALSLWLYSVYEDEDPSMMPEKKQEGYTARTGEKKTHELKNPKDDKWLEAEGATAKRNLHLLGSSTPNLCQAITWWVADGGIRTIEIDMRHSQTDGDKIEVDGHRVVGYMPGPELGAPPETSKEDVSKPFLAAESFSPLKTLFAQHLFSTFMWAAAKTMEDPIAGRADIRPKDGASDDSAWKSFTLHNTQLSALAQDIQSTGLGSLGEIYLSIIPPLSGEKKLPMTYAIIDWTREHAKPHEQQGRWRDASEAYLWLFRTANASFELNDTAVKATALLIEFLRALVDTIRLRKGQLFEKRAIEELEEVKSDLLQTLRNADIDILTNIMWLYQLQRRSWECEFVQDTEPERKRYRDLKFTTLHRLACGEEVGNWTIESWISEKGGSKEKDILDWTPLHYAVARPSNAQIEQLLKHTADFNTRDIRGRTPLHYACQDNGELAGEPAEPWIVETLIRGRANIITQDIDGIAPIHIAAMHGNESAVRLLFGAGAEVDVVDGLGSSPLLLAAYNGQEGVVNFLSTVANTRLRDHNGRTALHLVMIAEVEDDTHRHNMVRQLLEKNADVNAKDIHCWTPLLYAAKYGYKTIVELLLNKGAGIDMKEDEYGRTPLSYAAENGHGAVVELLLGRDPKPDIEAKDFNYPPYYGRTPLSWAAGNGHTDIVLLLLNHNADITAYDQTPLTFAAGNGHRDATQALLSKTDKWSMGWMPLCYAAKNGHEDVVRLLLDDGAELDAKDGDGLTPLLYAAEGGRKAVVQLLLDRQADINEESRGGWTALSYAAQSGHEDVVRLLLRNGAEMEAKNTYGQTPLSCAAKHGHTAVVQLLLNEGADIEAQNSVFYRTPLSWAAEAGHYAVVQLLLDHGAIMETKPFQSRPLSYAVQKDHIDVARLLRQREADIEAKNDG